MIPAEGSAQVSTQPGFADAISRSLPHANSLRAQQLMNSSSTSDNDFKNCLKIKLKSWNKC